jgi:polyphosphate kinase
MDFKEGSYFINRELSWLEFNQRVLDQAIEESNPLLERLKFLCIVASNLDEFFEVRVAGLKQQKQMQSFETGPDGLTASDALAAISKRVRRMVDDQYACWSATSFNLNSRSSASASTRIPTFHKANRNTSRIFLQRASTRCLRPSRSIRPILFRSFSIRAST